MDDCRRNIASVLTDCGFNVVLVAGNHPMDWGPEPLLDTFDLLRSKGIGIWRFRASEYCGRFGWLVSTEPLVDACSVGSAIRR